MKDLQHCQIGLYEKALPDDFPIARKLQCAKEAGYDFLELSIDENPIRRARLDWTKLQQQELIAICKKVGLPILTLCLSGTRSTPIGSEEADLREQGIALTRKAIDFAQDTGIRLVQIMGYDEFYNPQNLKTQNLYIDALNQLTAYAGGKSVILGIENIDAPFMNCAEKIYERIKDINSVYIQMYPDIGNIYASGVDVERDLSFTKGHTAAFHIKDSLPNIVRDVSYGEGMVDFVKFFQFLIKQGYSGLLTAEMWAVEDAEQSINCAVEARKFIASKMHEALDLMSDRKFS